MKKVTIEVAANIFVGADKHRVQIQTLDRSINIQVTIFQRLKAYVADTSGLIIAAAALVAPLATLIALVPKVREFFKNNALPFFRRRRVTRTDPLDYG